MGIRNCILSTTKLVWSRLTLSKITIAYTIFTLVHCLVQVALQTDAFIINLNADNFLKSILRAGGFPAPNGIDLLLQNNGAQLPSLYRCSINTANDVDECGLVWSPKGHHPNGTHSSNKTDTAGRTALSPSSAPIPFSPTLGFTTITPTATSTTRASPAPTETAHELLLGPTSIPGVLTRRSPKNESHNSHNGYSPPKAALTVGNGIFSSNGTLVSVPVTLSGPGIRQQVLLNNPGDHSSTLSNANTTGGAGADQDEDPDKVTLQLSPVCVTVLSWPLQKLATSGREDIVFLAFNVWMLGVSFAAILNESMPHMIAAVITHVLMTSWTVFQILNTMQFRSNFLHITELGACPGVNLLPSYWEERERIELAELIWNCFALLFSGYLSWKLVKQFGWQTFKRVGASRSVNHMYRMVLGLSVVLQLGLFFMLAGMALWIEQITTGLARQMTIHATAYSIGYIVNMVLLVPWLACGWFGVRRESKTLTTLFLVGAVYVTTMWCLLFGSSVYRLLFTVWRFFAMLSILSIILSITILILGLACRFLFGRNQRKLQDYIDGETHRHRERETKNDYSKDLEAGEMVEFPSLSGPAYGETFDADTKSVAYGGRGGPPGLSVQIPANAHLGSDPFSTPNSVSAILLSIGPSPHSKALERIRSASDAGLSSSNSNTSIWSDTSSDPFVRAKISQPYRSAREKSWVIE